MKDSVAAAIAEYQQYRHANNTDQDRCKHCGSFVSLPAPENGQIRYYCDACEKWYLMYVAQTQTVESD